MYLDRGEPPLQPVRLALDPPATVASRPRDSIVVHYM